MAQVSCSNCGGSRRVSCYSCHGSGKNGEYGFDGTEGSCFTCGGSGELSCPSCGGRGYVDDGRSDDSSSSSSYTPSSSSSYTPSSSGSTSGFNYAGDEEDFKKILYYATAGLHQRGEIDQAITIAKKLLKSFSWSDDLVEAAQRLLDDAKWEKEKAEAEALVAQGYAAQEVGDVSKAAEYYYQAAKLGDEDAIEELEYLADRYFNGLAGTPKDRAEGIKWWKIVADMGNAKAQYELGNCYQKGIGGMPQDIAQAKEWYTKAAANGNEEAKECLAEMVSIKSGSTEPQADAEDIYNQGMEAYNDDNYAKAVPLIQKAADMGSINAMSTLAWFYEEEEDIIPQDYAKSIYWLTKAAELGYLGSQCKLGEHYRDGTCGLAQDFAKAEEWFNKANATSSGSADSELAKLKEMREALNAKPGTLRYDGMYFYDGKPFIYLRFYDDGTVLMNENYKPPEDIISGFNKDEKFVQKMMTFKSTYQIKQGQISFHAYEYDFNGKILEDKLVLSYIKYDEKEENFFTFFKG